MSRALVIDRKEYVLSKQVLRSGTSIGTNISEAQHAESRKDFISKLSISLKEARETEYWIQILKSTNLIDTKISSLMIQDLSEIIALLTSSIKTTKKNL